MSKYKDFICFLGILAALTTGVPGLAQTTHIVTVGDNFFSPSDLNIATGDTVRWTNAAGGNVHNVTSNTGTWLPVQGSSFTLEVTFDTPGAYPYECTLHFGMNGSITVTGAADPDLELVSVNALDEGEGAQALRAGDDGATLPAAFRPGDELNIEATIRNNGGTTSDAFNITYYASTNSSITAQDTQLGSAAVAAIAGGATVNREDTVEIPDSLAAGQYFIGGILSIDDPDNTNNIAADPTSIQFAGPLQINAGLNDAWVIPGIQRQGILIAVLPSADVFFAAWFTYDVERPPVDATAMLGEPGHRWITLQGNWQGNTANLQIYVTAGGVFASPTPVPDPPVPVGTMTIEFHDCNSATATYEIPDLDIDDSFSMTRVVSDNVALCEELSLALQGGG